MPVSSLSCKIASIDVSRRSKPFNRSLYTLRNLGMETSNLGIYE
jgi:hypothetical protein